MSNVVTINGQAYSRSGLEALPRDPDLRQLARWVQENDFKYLDKHFGINQITS